MNPNLSDQYTGQTKLVYGEKYPQAHDWTVIFAKHVSPGGNKPKYTAFIVVYTPRNSLRERIIPLCSMPADDEEKALCALFGGVRTMTDESTMSDFSRVKSTRTPSGTETDKAYNG